MILTKGWAKQTKKKWEREGFWSWARRNFVAELWPLLFERKTVLWLEKDLADEIEPVEANIPLEITIVDDPSDDLVPLLLGAGKAYWGESGFVRETLKKGGMCYVGVNGRGIVAYQWISPSAERLGDVDCEPVLSKDGVYFFKSFTFPRCRGRRAIGALIARATRDLKAKGYRIASLAVRRNNASMLRSTAELGFSTRRIITRVRILMVLTFHLQKHVCPCRATLEIRPKGGIRGSIVGAGSVSE